MLDHLRASRYRILSPLGASGMGEVFLAEDTQLARGALLPVRQVVDIAPELTQALDAAHRRGVIHRDLEPAKQTVSLAVAAAVVIVVTALSSACRGDQPSPVAQPPAAAEITWREIGTWSGRLSQQTGSFEVSTVPMRLRWQTMRETSPGAGRLTVTLHSAVSGRLLQTIVDAHGVSSATVSVADEPRWCHFAIEAANVEWQMTLEQGFASDPR